MTPSPLSSPSAHPSKLDVLQDAWGLPRFLPPGRPSGSKSGSIRYEGLSYATQAGYRPLQMDVYVPSGVDRPAVVVWIHGGAWIIGDRRYLPETLPPEAVFDRLLAVGLAVATVDYRLSAEASFPAQLHDVKAAVRCLRHFCGELGLDGDRIAVWGESAGGHLAALVGLTGARPELEGAAGVTGPSSKVLAVVNWYGVADLTSMWNPDAPGEESAPEDSSGLPNLVELLVGDQGEESMRVASPISHVTAEAPPFLHIHGTEDVVVPVGQSQALHAALRAAGTASELTPVPGADHIFAGCPDIPALLRESVDFLATHLGRTG